MSSSSRQARLEKEHHIWIPQIVLEKLQQTFLLHDPPASLLHVWAETMKVNPKFFLDIINIDRNFIKMDSEIVLDAHYFFPSMVFIHCWDNLLNINVGVTSGTPDCFSQAAIVGERRLRTEIQLMESVFSLPWKREFQIMGSIQRMNYINAF